MTSSPSLLYVCVAYNATVLAECAAAGAAASQAASIAALVLPRIDHKTATATYTHGALYIHYLAETAADDAAPGPTAGGGGGGGGGSGGSGGSGGRVFLVVADAAAGRRLPFSFLAAVRDRYRAAFPSSSTSSSPPDSEEGTLPHYGRASFNATLQALMTEAETGDGSGLGGDALSHARRDIDDVRGIMGRNIESLLERGERIDLLVDQTDRLGGSAHEFRVRSRGLKRQMWWKNVKLMLLLALVAVLIVTTVVVAVKV